MSDLFKVIGERFALSVPLMKYDERTGEFEGWMAVDELDKAKEIIDLDKSFPHFEAWQNGFAKATDGASFGNVREQHDPKKAAGKLTAPLVKGKTPEGKDGWHVKGLAVDPVTKQKLADRVLVALSIGGEYVEKSTADEIEKGAVRYVARPSEVSLVDNPCMPSALITVVKADGTETIAKAVGFNPTQGFECRAGQFHVKKEDARKCDSDHTEPIEKAAEPAKPKVEKSLYGLSRLACILADLMSARSDAEYEAAWDIIAGETADSEVVDRISEAAQSVFDALEAIIADERAELAAGETETANNPVAEAVTDYAPVFEMANLIGALKKSATAKQLIKSLHVHTGNESSSTSVKEDTMEKKVEEKAAPVKAEEQKVEKSAEGELSKAATDRIAKAVTDGLSKALEPIATKVDAMEKAVNADIERITKTVKAIVDRVAPPKALKRVTKAEDGKEEAADHAKSTKSDVEKTSLDLMSESLSNPRSFVMGRLTE